MFVTPLTRLGEIAVPVPDQPDRTPPTSSSATPTSTEPTVRCGHVCHSIVEWVRCEPQRETDRPGECVMDGNRVEEQQDQPRGSHAAPEGAGVHPLIDLSRDPHPGRPDHAKPDEE